MRYIDKIIVHCSDTPVTSDIGADEIRLWHTEGRGWKDIGYHFIIRLSGIIEIGRPIEDVGAHTLGYNSNSVGICLVGGYHGANTFLAIQLESLAALIEELKLQYPSITTVAGHNDYTKQKTCPNFDVKKWYENYKTL